jgi:hypothetical protein
MAIVINGTTYFMPTDDGQRGITAKEQMLIEREFKRPLEKLFGASSLSEKALKGLSEEKKDAIEVEKRLAFLVMVWVARLRAGENLSFEEATDVELEKITPVENKEVAAPLEDSSSEEELKKE